MDIRQYFQVLWRRKWVVAVTLLATLAIVAAGSRVMKPVYQASSMIRLSEVLAGPAGYSDLTYSQQLQNTYVQLIGSRPYLDTVIQQLKLNVSPETLASMVKVQAVPSTWLIQITATDGNPAQAAAISNQLAVRALAQPPAAYTISIVEPAAVPTIPIRPQPALYLAIAALVGLLGGLGLAFLVESLDGTIHTAVGLGESAGAPLLGAIPNFRIRGQHKGQAALADGIDGTLAGEAFRVLSANTVARLVRGMKIGHAATILVASPEPGAGKSTVLSHLATTLAKEGQRVVVVGANLLHQDLTQVFGVSDQTHHNAVLSAPRDAAAALLNTGIPNVRILPSDVLSATLELPPAYWMRELLETLGREADVVLVDSPAILASADATTLAPLVDGVLLVAAMDKTTDHNLEVARTQIEAVGGKTLGVVFNRAKLPGRQNIYVAPVGGRVVPATKAALTRVTTPEVNGPLDKAASNHVEKLEKAS